MKISKVVLLTILPISSFGLYAQDGERAHVEKHLADLLYSEARDELGARLKNSGLSPHEVEDTVNKVMDGYARCMVAEILEDDNPMSMKFYETLANAVSVTELNQQFTDESESEIDHWLQDLSTLVDFCRMTIDQEAGLPAN